MLQKYTCRVHDEIDTTYQITLRNAKGELVFTHPYCLQCYDNFLQQHLDILKPVKDDEEEDSPL